MDYLEILSVVLNGQLYGLYNLKKTWRLTPKLKEFKSDNLCVCTPLYLFRKGFDTFKYHVSPVYSQYYSIFKNSFNFMYTSF